DETVSTLCFGPEASILVGVTYESNLFTYDITTHEVTSVVDLGITPTGAAWGRTPTLPYRKHDRCFSGDGGGVFFRVTAGGEVTILDDEHGWKTLTITARGEIYMFDPNRVYLHAFDCLQTEPPASLPDAPKPLSPRSSVTAGAQVLVVIALGRWTRLHSFDIVGDRP